MPNCPAKTYPLLDRLTLAAKVAAAGGPVINPLQSTGQASAHGVTLAWTINEGSITIDTRAKPFYVSCEQISSHLDDLFA